jgi:ubiquinone biosynthesis protein
MSTGDEASSGEHASQACPPPVSPDPAPVRTSARTSHGFDPAEALDIAQLVPEEYAVYRGLVRDALVFFLERLSPQRLAGILGQQLDMPRGASLAERIVALMRHCPTLHKLGQVVARDRRLALDLRKHLQCLETLTPTTLSPDVLTLIQREVGGSADLTIATRALAEASVAVVVPFTWPEPGSPTPQEGVFKVLRPGVEGRLQEDLEIWSALGAFLEQRCVRYNLPVLDYRDTLDRVSKLLLNEIRLDQEQAHLAQAAQFYADSPAVLIPRLFPFSTPRMTAMQRVHGCKVTDANGHREQRRRLAETLVEALVAQPFWLDAETATFHADPHAGNLLATPDGRLAILDWSLAAHLSKAQRVEVVQIVLGALTLDETRVCRALAALGERPPEGRALRIAVADALGQVRQGNFPGFDWLLGLLDRLVTAGIMGVPEDLVLFRKALLSLSGVVADVSEGCSVDPILINVGMVQFFREIASRTLAPADSRAFGTHVSNADLVGLWTSVPVTATRMWIGMWQDALHSLQAAL